MRTTWLAASSGNSRLSTPADADWIHFRSPALPHACESTRAPRAPREEHAGPLERLRRATRTSSANASSTVSAIAPMPGGGSSTVAPITATRARAVTAAAGPRTPCRADASSRRGPRRPASRGRRARPRARRGSRRARSPGPAAGCSRRPGARARSGASRSPPSSRARRRIPPPSATTFSFTTSASRRITWRASRILREPLAKLGEQRVGLVHLVQALLGHHDDPEERRELVHRGDARAGGIQESLAPVDQHREHPERERGFDVELRVVADVDRTLRASRPARAIASSKIRGSGFSNPSTPETTLTWK